MDIHSVSSSASLQQMQKNMFAKVDADGNGSVNLEEFKAIGKHLPVGMQRPAGAPDPSEIFSKLDADGSGAISETELANAPRPPFDGGMSLNLVQSLENGQTSLVDALFKDRHGNDRAKGESQSVQSDQDLAGLIQQYMEAYLSKPLAQTAATYQVAA